MKPTCFIVYTRRLLTCAALATTVGTVGACTSAVTYQDVPAPFPDDRQSIPAPEYRKIVLQQDAFEKTVSRQASEFFDLARQFRRWTGNKKESFNTNAFDEVNNSSWFTNRHHISRMSAAEIERGATTGTPPSLDRWTIVGAKLEGVTPGFTIKDGKGDRYVIKFDPPGWPELATSTELITSRLFYAAGYNTPENYLVFFRPEIVQIGEGTTVPDEKTREPRQMRQSDLDNIWRRVDFRPDGAIRAVASKFISGKIIGPYRYNGTRSDDPNDFVPHQHRRELRGLRVLAAWLNHWDTKANNSLDAYVEDGGRHYVRHYLIDFGSTLGSQGDEPMPEWVGFENQIDPHQIFWNTITLGFYEPSWYRGREVEYREIGLFDNKDFDPQSYKFIIPNEAFEMLTKRDAFWAAKIVMSFTDDDLRAAIASAHYTNPDAAEYLLNVLAERRDIIGRHWMADVNALDRFETVHHGDQVELRFSDRLVEGGLADGGPYQYTITNEGEPPGEPIEVGNDARIPLPSDRSGIIHCRVRQQRLDGKGWANWVDAFVNMDGRGKADLVGVLRRE